MIRHRGVTVLPATVADSAMLAALHAEAFAQPWSVDGFATMQRSPGVFAVLAWPRGAGKADEPAGFILCRAVADEAEIMTLAVRPARRRRGIGEALVSAAAARLGQAGIDCAEVTLHVGTDAASRGCTGQHGRAGSLSCLRVPRDRAARRVLCGRGADGAARRCAADVA